MKYLLMLLTCFATAKQVGQAIYVCKNANVSLYSKAPIEDIEAKTAKGTSVYNAATGDINFSVPIRSFKFDKALMEEHFNENYMESEKYPQASFKGKISNAINLSGDGIYPVSATGILEVHGVKQNRTIPGTITVHNGTVSMAADFIVKCADHHITIPTLVFHNIAETIRIQMAANYEIYKK
jgi:polyisoprenoid-binding protein YceI